MRTEPAGRSAGEDDTFPRRRRIARVADQLFRRERQPGDFAFAAGAFVLSLALLALLPFQTTWAPRTAFFAQPGFWPGVAIAAMVLFSGGHLLGAWVSERQPGRRAELLTWLRALEFAGWFLAYVFLVPRLGYLPSSLLFACALTARMGYRGLRWQAAAALFAVVVVVVFKTGLGVNIPAGAVYDQLPGGLRSFAITYF